MDQRSLQVGSIGGTHGVYGDVVLQARAYGGWRDAHRSTWGETAREPMADSIVWDLLHFKGRKDILSRKEGQSVVAEVTRLVLGAKAHAPQHVPVSPSSGADVTLEGQDTTAYPEISGIRGRNGRKDERIRQSGALHAAIGGFQGQARSGWRNSTSFLHT